MFHILCLCLSVDSVVLQADLGHDAMQSLSTQPMSSQPMSSQPMSSQPMSTQPMSSQPLTSQPMSSQPLSAQPLLVRSESNLTHGSHTELRSSINPIDSTKPSDVMLFNSVSVLRLTSSTMYSILYTVQAEH